MDRDLQNSLSQNKKNTLKILCRVVSNCTNWNNGQIFMLPVLHKEDFEEARRKELKDLSCYMLGRYNKAYGQERYQFYFLIVYKSWTI